MQSNVFITKKLVYHFKNPRECDIELKTDKGVNSNYVNLLLNKKKMKKIS